MTKFTNRSLCTFLLLVWTSGVADPGTVFAPDSAGGAAGKSQTIIVGCKHFTEGYILGEIIAQLLEDRGYHVERKFGLGGTLICFDALRNEDIDIYPEYSGTITQAILKLDDTTSYPTVQQILIRDFGLELLGPFGFNNTYAIAVTPSLAERLQLNTVSDLARFPKLRLGFSYEFLNRHDGWPGLARTYRLPGRPVGIEHGLAYQALRENDLDVTDVYTTDGDIDKYGLVLLKDDKEYFPRYLGAPLLRRGLSEGVKRAVGELAGKISEKEMQSLNASVLIENKTFREVAQEFLSAKDLLLSVRTSSEESKWTTMLHRTATHIKLTVTALIAAMAIAIPLGVLVYRLRAIAKPVIYFTGLLQTIPSIALLAFMIPLLGIGVTPAIVALFLYALLPILRNTSSALFSIDPLLKKISVGMGLTTWQQLRHIEIPLAAPTILAGIKTAAVINVGTATLAAFIGAGGLGEPIVTGLALNDTSLILEGAVPAALLAIVTEFVFESIEKFLIPKHLLQQRVR